MNEIKDREIVKLRFIPGSERLKFFTLLCNHFILIVC